MGGVKSLLGKVFGKLTVLELLPERRQGAAVWQCRCECGNTTQVRGISLSSGNTKSCGCFHADVCKKHGLRDSEEYHSWASMIQRCYNKNSKSYANYGGRGILVCAEWRGSFLCFLKDMGKRPTTQHSLDRVDNNGNYEPTNCRWATPLQQRNNQRPRGQYKIKLR